MTAAPHCESRTEPLTLCAGQARLEIDSNDGRVLALRRDASSVNWVAAIPGKRFGSPFVQGTQKNEVFLNVRPKLVDGRIEARSEAGLTRLDWIAAGDALWAKLELPRNRGPRAGLELDLNILDMPTDTPWSQQVMPVVICTADDLGYAYFLWHGGDRQYLLMVVDGPLAAWRIKYSASGHLMQGFQVLTQVDDVLCPDGRRLPVVDRLNVGLCFVESVDEGLERAASMLGLAIVAPAISGGVVGAEVPLRLIGNAARVVHQTPSGPTTDHDVRTPLPLNEPGIHHVIADSASGRRHVTRVFAVEPWESLYDRCNRFHREHFQHPCGAFYTAIHTDTLKPDGMLLEGRTFGDPMQRQSCRSGEFGGFAGWAMIKNLLQFGHKPDLRESADRYILNWALNRGHEDTPYYDTICKHPFEFAGMKWSAYHLYHEINFLQAETFFLNELVDYVRLTGDASVLEDAVGLAEHMIADHADACGRMTCQNRPHQARRDYTTVDAPGVALARLLVLLRERKHPKADFFFDWCCRIADYLVQRGLAFPTEGEPCTEDGSLACTAWTLLHAHLFVRPTPAWRDHGLTLLDLHEKLVLRGTDCRMNNSSLRFWETQYETDSWGPSINAGHGWTIWTCIAKYWAYRITSRTDYLADAYAGFLACLSKIDPCGGMRPCYTPDLIPGTPHPWVNRDLEIVGDTQVSSTPLAWGYPGTYSASGNHALIWAHECWSGTSGVTASGALINARFDNEGVLVSAAPAFERLALVRPPQTPLHVRVEPGRPFEITLESGAEHAVVTGARIVERGATSRCIPDGDRLTVAQETSRP